VTPVPPPPPAAPSGAAALFGDRLPHAERFVALLADTGVGHGLIGPREVPRLWERHVLNCAVIADAFPEGSTVIDVGSGAGLPGLALAIVRPDLVVHLVEPMHRRTAWLAEATAVLDLDRVTVHRGRAEELAGLLRGPFVTARAVARLGSLARWCRPLLEDDGLLVAMKGSSAATELEQDHDALVALGMVHAEIREHGAGLVDPPTVTVCLTFAGAVESRSDPTRPRRDGAGGLDGRRQRGRRPRGSGSAHRR